jgi:hypothetical protein
MYHIKRELSYSRSTDHHLTDSIKRVKINRPEMTLSLRKPSENYPLVSVMSSARDDFSQRYEIVKEVGKGGFSTVYQCRNRATGLDYAVKVGSAFFSFVYLSLRLLSLSLIPLSCLVFPSLFLTFYHC